MTAQCGALPGEQTLIGSWRALTQISPGARMINFPAAIAAVFPSWTPLNNAILLTPHDDLAIATVVSQLITIYSGAGVNSWALWMRSKITDLGSPDAGREVSGLQRDTT